MQNLDKLEPFSDPEKRLLKAAIEGQAVRFGDSVPELPDPSRVVRASIVKEMLLGGSERYPTHPRGVFIEGAWIQGALSLDHCHCRFRLLLSKCNLPELIDLEHATVAEFSLNGSRIQGLHAHFASFTGGVNLRDGFSSENTVNFTMSNIHGSLSFDGGSFLAEKSLSAYCEVDSINLQGATISGSLVMGATSKNDSDAAPVFEAFGTVRMTEAVILGSARFTGSHIQANSGVAIFGQGAKISNSLSLSRGREDSEKLVAAGRIDFNSCEIGGQVLCGGAQLTVTKQDNSVSALNFNWSKIGGSFIILQSNIEGGGIGIGHSEFKAQVTISQSSLDNSEGIAIKGNNSSIADSFLCHDLAVRGAVCILQSSIAGNLEFVRCEIFGGYLPMAEGRVALICESCFVGSSLFIRQNFRSVGRVSLSSSEVKRNLEFKNCVLNSSESYCLTAESLKVDSLFLWQCVKVAEGGVSLLDASFGSLVDDLSCWPNGDQLVLTGLEFDRFSMSNPNVADRISWISNSVEGKRHSQPYQNLASVYRKSGNRSAAKKVLIAMEHNIRGNNREWLRNTNSLGYLLAPIVWFWDVVILRLVVGYGYSPGRSFWAALLLISATAACVHEIWETGDFAPDATPILVSQDWKRYAADETIINPAKIWSQRGNEGQDYETFKAVLYAVDVVVPLVDLSQDDAWAVSTERSWKGRYWHNFEWFLRLAGWAIAALLGASLTGLIKND